MELVVGLCPRPQPVLPRQCAAPGCCAFKVHSMHRTVLLTQWPPAGHAGLHRPVLSLHLVEHGAILCYWVSS